MKKTYELSGQKTLWDDDEHIFSPGSRAGPTPSNSPDGPPTGPSGRRRARVPRSPQQEKNSDAQRVEAVLFRALEGLDISSASNANTPGTPTGDTSGQRCGGSSATADLQSCLANRLREAMASSGTPEYVLRWKDSATPLGVPICALVARARKAKDGLCVGIRFAGNPSSSARRTSDSAFSGWPSPKAMDATSNVETAASKLNRGLKTGLNLPTVATFAGWPTTKSSDGHNGLRTPDGAAEEFARKGVGADLPTIAALAGWPTPMAGSPGTEDYNPAGNTDSSRTTVALAGWATPMGNDREEQPRMMHKARADGGQPNLAYQASMATGPTSISSPAPTEKRGGLNAAFSRWLQGYPKEWCEAALTVHRSTRTPRRKRVPPASEGTAIPSSPP